MDESIKKYLEDEKFCSYAPAAACVRYAVVPEEAQFGVQNFLIHQYRPRFGAVAMGVKMIMPVPLPFRTSPSKHSPIRPITRFR